MAGVVESLKGAGGLGIAIFILAFVGNFFNWIAFTTASWARQFPTTSIKDYYIGYGLWRKCDGGPIDELVIDCTPLDGTNVAHYGAVQALVSVGFLGMNVLFFIIVLKMFTSLCSSVGDIDKINGIQAIATGVIYLIGIIIFGAEYGDGNKLRSTKDGDLGYSFILAIFAMLLQLVVGVILLVMSMKGSGSGGSVGAKA